MGNTDPVVVVDEFVKAYNGGDDDALLGLCAEKLYVQHHNRDVVVEGREAFGELLGGFKAAFPDKRFVNRRALHVVDDETVLVEHTWTANATADVPGFANKGETARLDLCTRYTIKDGLIVEYHDYG